MPVTETSRVSPDCSLYSAMADVGIRRRAAASRIGQLALGAASLRVENNCLMVFAALPGWRSSGDLRYLIEAGELAPGTVLDASGKASRKSKSLDGVERLDDGFFRGTP